MATKNARGVQRFIDKLKTNLEDSVRFKRALLADEAALTVFGEAVETVVRAYRRGGRLYIAGNGGSAADAQHLAAEFVSKFARPRSPLPAEALTVDTSVLTAIANDYGYDELFARQIAGKMSPTDVLLAITTSGRSRNIVRALEQCRAMGIRSLLFAGRDGGAAKPLADHCLLAPGESTNAIQEVHILLAHALCQCVEDELFPA